jgi:hypothetical protein
VATTSRKCSNGTWRFCIHILNTVGNEIPRDVIRRVVWVFGSPKAYIQPTAPAPRSWERRVRVCECSKTIFDSGIETVSAMRWLHHDTQARCASCHMTEYTDDDSDDKDDLIKPPIHTPICSWLRIPKSNRNHMVKLIGPEKTTRRRWEYLILYYSKRIGYHHPPQGRGEEESRFSIGKSVTVTIKNNNRGVHDHSQEPWQNTYGKSLSNTGKLSEVYLPTDVMFL